MRVYCSDILCTFRQQSFLNSIWNTTQYKATSFFLISLHLLPKSSVYFPLHGISISIACALSRICAHVCYIHADGLALQCCSLILFLLTWSRHCNEFLITRAVVTSASARKKSLNTIQTSYHINWSVISVHSFRLLSKCMKPTSSIASRYNYSKLTLAEANMHDSLHMEVSTQF